MLQEDKKAKTTESLNETNNSSKASDEQSSKSAPLIYLYKANNQSNNNGQYDHAKQREPDSNFEASMVYNSGSIVNSKNK